LEGRYWCGTLHPVVNKKSSDYESFPKEAKAYRTGKGASIMVSFTCGQEERGENGGYHMQFYVEFEKKVKLTTLKNNFSQRIHWLYRNGTAEQASHYATKGMECEVKPLKDGEMRYPETRWWEGMLSDNSPGKRNDLDDIKEMILTGKKRKQIAMERAGTYMRNYRGIQAWADAVEIDIDEDVSMFHKRECYIYYGMAGAGKTLAAKHLIGDDSWYSPQKNAAGQYSFETYRGQKWLWLEEFVPTNLHCDSLKQIMDRGRCVLPARGTGNSKPGRHSGVVITTNQDPEFWYDKKGATVDWKAISRRCKQVWLAGHPETGSLEDDWMIIGGTEHDNGYSVPTPLTQLQAWADARDAAQRPEDVETEDETE